jgi:putative heme iron utilization protein
MTTSADSNGDRPPALTPSPAERCRTLVAAARAGALSTLAREPVAFPYGSLVLVATDEHGRPLLLISSLAEHTQNLTQSSHASILLTEPALPDRSPLALGRVTLLGACAPVGDAERDAARRVFLTAHPEASSYAAFKDFVVYRLEPAALRYVGGFGRMAWVSAADYRAAEPDPLATLAPGILAHMNGDHGDALLAYARGLARIPDVHEATMAAVDRYGFDIAVKTPGGETTVRVGFEAPATTSEEVRRAMVALAKAARAALA